jgi:predicted amidophosphoribosyltransferase
MATTPGRCPSCWCAACAGLLSEHRVDGCRCEDCVLFPETACGLAGFEPPERIAIIAGQLGPLLSVHLGLKQQQRCLFAAHATHHALLAYDHPEETPDA